MEQRDVIGDFAIGCWCGSELCQEMAGCEEIASSSVSARLQTVPGRVAALPVKHSSELQPAITYRPVLVELESAQCLRVDVLEHVHSLVVAASLRQLDRLESVLGSHKQELIILTSSELRQMHFRPSSIGDLLA